MAYWFNLDGFKLFVHIPKTGGCWIEQFLASLINVDIRTSEYERPTGMDYRHWLHPKIKENWSFTSVRHPLTWYESVWRYRIGVPRNSDDWHPLQPLMKCWNSDFNKFIRLCIQREPSFVTRLYEWYCGPPGLDYHNVIIRQESLEHDMQKLVRDLGYTGEFIKIPFVNESKKTTIKWDTGLLKEVERLERPTIQRWFN